MLSLALLLLNQCLLLLLSVIKCVEFVRILADNSRLLSSSSFALKKSAKRVIVSMTMI